MNCDDVWPQLLHYQRGQVSTLQRKDIRVHLQACPACAHEVAADALLTETLERRLPQHAAPLGLKRRLAVQWLRTSPHKPSWWARWRLSVVPALATATVLLITVPIYYGQIGPFQSGRSASMVTEAVTNHLRLLSSQHPLDIESGNMHQVKPWYEAGSISLRSSASSAIRSSPWQAGRSGTSSIGKPQSLSFIDDCTRSHSSCSPHGDYRGPRVVSYRWVLSGPPCPRTGGSTSSSGARASKDMS